MASTGSKASARRLPICLAITTKPKETAKKFHVDSGKSSDKSLIGIWRDRNSAARTNAAPSANGAAIPSYFHRRAGNQPIAPKKGRPANIISEQKIQRIREPALV